jgi:hypothetical protein
MAGHRKQETDMHPATVYHHCSAAQGFTPPHSTACWKPCRGLCHAH